MKALATLAPKKLESITGVRRMDLLSARGGEGARNRTELIQKVLDFFF